MKIVQLTRSDRELFLDMDPLDKMELLEFPGAFALAAVVEQEETGADIPAGLTICRDTGESMIVHWLCVSEKYRRQGIGERLLAAVYDAAGKAGYPTVCAYLNHEYGRELICAGEETYLKDHFFTQTRPLAGEWVANIRTLKNADLLKGKAETEAIRVISMRTLPQEERQAALRLLKKGTYAAGLYPPEENWKYLDADVSCLLWKNGKPAGALLLQSTARTTAQIWQESVSYYTGQVLYPVFLCMESVAGLKILLQTVLKQAEAKYGADSELHILMKKGTYAPLVERLLPDVRIENKLMIASVEDYQKQEKRPERHLPFSLC